MLMRLYVGLDWASSEHAVCVVDEQRAVRAQFRVAHSAAGLAALHTQLRAFGEPAELPVAIERPSGVVVDTLVEAGFPVIPIHPNVVKASRPRYHDAASKSDPHDAYLLADLLRTDGHRFRRLRPPERHRRHLARHHLDIHHRRLRHPRSLPQAPGRGAGDPGSGGAGLPARGPARPYPGPPAHPPAHRTVRASGFLTCLGTARGAERGRVWRDRRSRGGRRADKRLRAAQAQRGRCVGAIRSAEAPTGGLSWLVSRTTIAI
jgi:hypothetical protein